MLYVIFASAVMYGGNRPFAWIFLAVAVLVPFFFAVVSGRFGSVARASSAVLAVELLAVALILLETTKHLVPPGTLGLAPHPSWALAEAAIGPVRPRLGADPDAAAHHLLRLSCYLAIFATFVRSGGRPERALRRIAVLGGALCAYGLVAMATNHNVIGLDDAFSNGGVVRSTFVNRNSFATFAGMILVVSLALLYRELTLEAGVDGRSARDALEAFFGAAWLPGLCALVAAAALILSQSRAGLGSAVLGVLALAMLRRRRRERVHPGVWVAVAALGALLATTLSSGVLGRLMATRGESMRFTIYPEVLASAMERPWLGHGLGSFHDVFRADVPFEAATGEWDLAHNAYLENLFEMGVPGAALMYGALGLLCILLAWRATGRRRDAVAAQAAFACTVLVALHSVMDFSMQMPAIAALYSAIAGLGASEASVRGGERPDRLSSGSRSGRSSRGRR